VCPLQENSGRMQKLKVIKPEPTTSDQNEVTFLKMINAILTRRLELRLQPYPQVGGDLVFSVSLRDLGFANPELKRLGEMLGIRFYADVIGELIVRRNIETFLNHVSEENMYEVDAQLAVHQHYGVGITKGRVYFIFHVSRIWCLGGEQIEAMLR